MQIIPVASGKGGVGKTLIAANLAVILAQAGHRVILADLDLGQANLHLMLGLNAATRGIGSFIKNKQGELKDYLRETPYEGLHVLAGDPEIPGLANLSLAEKNRLLKGLISLEADYLILDLGAGSSAAVTDFFLLSRRGLLVIMPTISSALNAYIFIKNVLFRLLLQFIKPKTKSYQIIKKTSGPEMPYANLLELLAKIKTIEPELATAYQQKLQGFMPRLVLNLMENEKDIAYAERIRRSFHEYLGLEVEHLGVIYRDVLQDIALNSKIPIVIYKPRSLLAQAIIRLAEKIMAHPEEEGGLLEFDPDETFQIAELEALKDFQEKVNSVQELMQSGSLTTGDLLDIIKQQYIELSNLKKENQLLKQKLSRAVQEGFRL